MTVLLTRMKLMLVETAVMMSTVVQVGLRPPKSWRIVQLPFQPMTHTSVSTFNWKLLLDKD